MDVVIVKHLFPEMQHYLSWRYETERLKENLVYCPMCEVTHANNTNCQRNDHNE